MMMRRLSRLQNNLLTLGAVLGALCLIVAIAAALTGAKPLVFRSGSMAPSIPTGALGISIPAEAKSISIGDVISVENAAGVRITHRVVQADVAGETATVTLKGDANSVADAAPYVLREADRVVAHFPLLGYAVAWLSSSAAVFAGGLLTAYLLYIAFGSSRRRSRPGSPGAVAQPQAGQQHRTASRRAGNGHRSTDRRQRAARISAMAAAGLAVLSGGALDAATPSQAAFLDAAPATSQLTATSLMTPTLTCSQAQFLGLDDTSAVNLSWNHNDGSIGTTGYEMTTQVVGGAESARQPYGSATATLKLSASTFSGSGSGNVTIRIYSKYNSWVSPAGSALASYTSSSGGGLFPATLRCPVP